jgi:predicted pyridoxine 5'-phosphate oxidase superfamily flavin-nucleotide-binding protein
MARKYHELMMTRAVQDAQRHYYGGSQSSHALSSDADTPLGARETSFIALRDSFYVATISEAGWPYVQHRGGPKGFLRVIDSHTLAFPDFHGNSQLLSTGNLAGSDRVALFLMDYPERTRLKIMGHARVLDAREEKAFAKELSSSVPLPAKIERIFVIHIVSFDWNCPQYITQRYTEEEVEAEFTAPLRARIGELEAASNKGS